MSYRGTLPPGQGFGGQQHPSLGYGHAPLPQQQQQQPLHQQPQPTSYGQTMYGSGQPYPSQPYGAGAGTGGGGRGTTGGGSTTGGASGGGSYAPPHANHNARAHATQPPPQQALQYGADAMLDGTQYFPTTFDSYGHNQTLQFQPAVASIPQPSYETQQPVFVQPSDLFQRPPTSFQAPKPRVAQPPQPPLPPQPSASAPSPSEVKIKQEASPKITYIPPPQVPTTTSHNLTNNTSTYRAPPTAESSGTTKPSPRPSVASSPALSTKSVMSAKSPGISKMSPGMTPKEKPPPFDSVAVLVSIAEECFQAAHGASSDVAKATSERTLRDYQRLISTGLACLETALRSDKLSPRQEAKMRLRYATVLSEETENLMEAETTLSKGITLCEKHRYIDLKYCMQYLLLRVLFQRNQRAALKATDTHIANATALRHIHWVYAFRFLKASFHMQSNNPSDSAALENLRSTAALATQRGDKALIVFASLLEALTLMKTMKADTVERIQTCIAHVSKYQLDPTVQIPQLEFLTTVVDLACSLHVKNADMLTQKLKQLDARLTDYMHPPTWEDSVAEILLPIRKAQSSTAATISEETAGVLRQGPAGTASDFLVMSFATKLEIWALCMTYSGLAGSSIPTSRPTKPITAWEDAVNNLHTCSAQKLPPTSLQRALKREAWRKDLYMYIKFVIGLFFANTSRWHEANECLQELQKLQSATTDESLRLMTTYLLGCCHQGRGDTRLALDIFTDHFPLSPSETGTVRSAKLDLCLLAALNRLWILQHPSVRNPAAISTLVEQLRPLCTDHHDPAMRAAWFVVQATISVAENDDPPVNVVKSCITGALGLSKTTGNSHFLAITLCIMRQRLFDQVVGDQAIKSALAAAHQAVRDGNHLWQSVADGMLAQSYDIVGEKQNAKTSYTSAMKHAQLAFADNEPERS